MPIITLRSSYGPVEKYVSDKEPRECALEEVPIIDVGCLRTADMAELRALADKIKAAATQTGFFYIVNHGVSRESTERIADAAKRFFKQPVELKEKANRRQSRYFNGWQPPLVQRACVSESLDHKEGFSFRYDPQFDPAKTDKDVQDIPDEISREIRGEQFVWDSTAHIAGFKDACIGYWQQCLELSRRLIQVFALTLDLPLTYFDKLVTYPGADCVLNYYPAQPAHAGQPYNARNAGLGAHTDLQCLTLLWQDATGGLQVLNKDNEWVIVPPLKDSLVVNIGDYLMRLTNDRFKSTVHRVYPVDTSCDRYSVPFFFGFNFNETCAVLPSCTSATEPAKYAPISCGEWCQLRFKQESFDDAVENAA
ncbi:hypothetical protein CANCADRAFT_135278 [Tortispora caseinolytica NRRL Y-17796]|uniref:Fe2OG dioxygenase domain-containing protein n=1 Tax=Tortispora caseinolytica NRRL Y-17796 TaxID=767744 RepID=A0A1E4TC11_9ASCO|nr:hypothetical protein CANCADRAFT_135278 [Tortispora caseinolytica NRRL Y-17796]